MLPIVLDSCQGVEAPRPHHRLHQSADLTAAYPALRHCARYRLHPAPWVKWRITDKGQLETYGTNWRSTPDHGLAFRPEDARVFYRRTSWTWLPPNKDIRR